jgi:hypothetical protein
MNEQELLERAIAEINQLRRDNELMRARNVRQYLFATEPFRQRRGLTEDIVQYMQKRITEINANQVDEKQQVQPMYVDKNNNCTLCGRPVGNTVFTVCDGCWDKKEQK